MSDCRCDHSDETVKLVEYSIVSIKPCEERVIRRGQLIYSDEMGDDGFAAWVIARYFQGEDDDDLRFREHDETDDEKRRRYERRDRRELTSYDKRYLRVYHRVLETWTRPDDCYDDRQINALRGIERALRERGLPS